MLHPATKDAYTLFHEGVVTLSQVEHNGVRIDVEYLNRTMDSIQATIKSNEEKLIGDSVFKKWRKRFGEKTKLGSRQQLGSILFRELGYTPQSFTTTGQFQVDESTFESIDLPFVKLWQKTEKLKKLNSTYLMALHREVCNGFLHPSFNLHFVSTYRSSSDSPNFQNIPIRDPEIGAAIRKAFIPRDGYVMVEADYGALEFRIAANFWKDAAMISYASDPTKDVHRDQAADCYACDPDQVTKQMRYCGKNMFVFPILYGSDYINCSKNLWEAISQYNLELKDGTPVLKHLKKKGITQLGNLDRKAIPLSNSFEGHIKKVQKRFDDRFPEFGRNKDPWWDGYCSKGWFQLMTGFVISGVFTRNLLMNAPIQGPGFHCLLWSMNQIQKWLNKYRMKTKIIGQIHDCILLDAHKSELQTVLNYIRYAMTERVKKHYKWIVTPMEVEVDVVLNGETWYDKKPWVEKDGIWSAKA